jgi:cholesterol oxidase
MSGETMRLAREPDQMQASYDAVVVGSGYGAGVAASRLARMGFSVAVLERGREFAIGEFPDTLPEATQELQYVFNGRHEGKRTGLFELHYGRDMHVLVGCGLGGTSLINANVALPPDPRVWEDPRWPTELFHDDTLEEGFARARHMLRPVPYPNDKPLDKLTRLGEAATALGAELSHPPINVAFKTGPNAAGVVQPACNLCGDCCSGCNVGAKTTVQMTYLPDAANHGAEIFTGATVRHVKKEADGWRVLYTPTAARRDGFRSPERSIAAKIVVLGAGALGSTEILLRSRAEGLAVSDRLGQAFTGNGDVLAFAYNGDKSVNAVGVGVPPRTDIAPPGPCITGAIDLRASSSLDDGMIIEEGVLPSGLAEILPVTFNVGRIFGKDTDHGPVDELQETARRAASALLGTWRGAMHNTATFLVMAHDGSAGRLEMDDDDRIRVDWPGISKEPVFARIGDALRNAAAVNGATYVRNPIQNTFLGKNVITVHPLGGCGMGRDKSQGVVDHACRVYDTSPGAGPDAVHDGLYVCDGAAIPRSVGVNPLLTITALAERAMMHVAKSSGRDLSDAPKADAPVRTLQAAATRPATGLGALARKIGFHDLTRMAADSIAMLKSAGKSTPPPTAVPATGAGVEFTERMTGYLSDKPGIDYAEAAATGKAAGSDFSFTVAVRIADIDAFIRDSAHAGTLSGTAICPALSPDPLDISNGIFRLMRRSDEQVETRLFEYLMTLTTREGRSFEFKGVKYVHDDRRADLVADTTTLFIDLSEAGGTGSAARGILRIKPLDFARQVRTLKAVGGTSHIERASAVAKFGALFAGALFDIYGDVFAPVRRFDAERVRKKRGLRAAEPQVFGFVTADGKRLRLTRYNGGTKGPLLFSHGLGVSSLIFRIDTIDTNLLEFMYEQGYDCWLLDFRASIDLPYAKDAWTADDCAREDYQPAVDLIRRETGAPSIQVLAHCFGATTFVMAMLGGHLTGVRSAVISQIAADVVVPFYPQRLLAYLRLPAVFDVLGIPAVNARATVNDGLVNRIADGMIRVAVPFQREERSRNATSNRITALYGQLYETDQLNALTFETGLPEMFGEANIAAFKQLALIARRQTIVDAAGNDAYMPHLERLSIPISFIHGGENACFLPESTARTLAKLSARNGAHLYDRHVIPKYGHIDCIFGKSAVVDVYPKMLAHLEETAALAR